MQDNSGFAKASNEFWAMPSKDRPATTPDQPSIRNLVNNVQTTGAAIGNTFRNAVGGKFGRNIPSYKKGGNVKKTGMAYLHKGERVITKSKSRALSKAKSK